MSGRNFGFLGSDFQNQLLKVLIEDARFAGEIIDFLEPKYFDNLYAKYIVQLIKEFYGENLKTPNYETLILSVKSENEGKDEPKVHLDTLNNIRNSTDTIDVEFIKKTSMNFCKQQVLKREIKRVQSIIDTGKFGEYEKIEEIIIKALQVGTSLNDVTDVFDNIDDVLSVDSRVPIPTGIDGIDNLLKGGLSIGELGVVIAPTGVGKTTLLTKFANSAHNVGYNVLHIVFEDNLNAIKQKHYTIWSGISPNDHVERREEVKSLVEEKQEASEGTLKILKLPSDSVTLSKIKTKIRKLKAEGLEFQLIVIDYVDCINSETNVDGEEWKGEGKIMRQIESMTDEFNAAIWVATQGNRESIKNEVVTSDQVGGNVKKTFIAHVVISVGKSMDQKEHKLATISMLKNRIGGDGVIFHNCPFDNEYIKINTDEQSTMLGFRENKEEERKNRAADLFKKSLPPNNNQ